MIKDMNKIKAITLFLSDRVKKTTCDRLIASLISTGELDVADITDAFLFLTEDGLLSVSEDKYCELSAMGKEILPDLSSILDDGAYMPVIEEAVRFHNGTEYEATVSAVDERYILCCTVYENRQPTCVIELYFEDENDAIRAKMNFLKRPDAVIKAVRASVTGNVGYMM